MAVTIVVLSAPAGADVDAEPAMALTFDSPRLVIGRGEGADIRLPDPSVSPRHASLRARGAEWVLLDEGSTNGTRLGGVLLPAQSPRVVRSGDRVRVGRVWLEIAIGAATPPSPPGAAHALALELVTRALEAEKERARPRVRVEGSSTELELTEPGRPYVVGRARECDLTVEAEDVARRHVQLTARGARVVVQDLGSRAGTLVDGVPIGTQATPWKPGQRLAIGSHVLSLEHPAADALAELERSPDERMRPDEQVEPAPAPAKDEAAPQPTPAAPAVTPELLAPGEPDEAPLARRRAGWNVTDAAVLLLAAGVLTLSIAALFWLFCH